MHGRLQDGGTSRRLHRAAVGWACVVGLAAFSTSADAAPRVSGRPCPSGALRRWQIAPRGTADDDPSVRAFRQAGALHAALVGLKRAFKAAGPDLRATSASALAHAVSALTVAIENAHGTAALGMPQVRRVRRALKQAGGRLTRAVATAEHNRDFPGAQHAFKVAAALGAAVTALEFREVRRRTWSLRDGWGTRPEALVWRGHVLDTRALARLAEATVRMEASRLAEQFSLRPTETDLEALLDAPYWIREEGLQWMGDARGRNLTVWETTPLLTNGETLRVIRLLEGSIAYGDSVHSTPEPPAGLAALVERAHQLRVPGWSAPPKTTGQLTELLDRLPQAWNADRVQ